MTGTPGKGKPQKAETTAQPPKSPSQQTSPGPKPGQAKPTTKK